MLRQVSDADLSRISTSQQFFYNTTTVTPAISIMGTQSAISDHDTKILSILREQRLQGLFTDVKIVSSNSVFWAHACILAPFSLLVSKIFYSKNFQGTENKWSAQSPCTLKITSSGENSVETNPNKSKFCEECIQKVIDFIYCGQITVDEEHVEHVKFITHFLEIENLSLTSGSAFKEKLICNNKTPTLEPNVKQETKSSNLLKEHNSSFKKEETKLKLKQKPVRTSFKNILRENSFLASSYKSSSIQIDGVPQKKDSCVVEEQSCNSELNVVKDSTNILESFKGRITSAVETADELEYTSKKVKTSKKHKPNPSDLLCLFCPFEGSSILELLNHKLNTCHEKDTVCFLCSSDFSSNSELQVHLNEHLKLDSDIFTINQNGKGTKVYKCDQCDKEFRWRQNFQRHLSSHMAPSKKCASCDFTANTDYALKYHVKKVHTDFFHSCYHENCSFKTKRKGNLKNHILSVHKKTRLCCPNCDKTFSQKKNLQRHVNLYHNTSTTIHHCSLCTYVTHRADNLQKHKLSMHSKAQSSSQTGKDHKILEKCQSSPINFNVISPQNCGNEQSSFTQKSLDVNFCLRDLSTNITENNSNFSTPVVSVTCNDFNLKSPSFSGGQLGLSCGAFTQNSPGFSMLGERNAQVSEQVSQMISLPHIDCNNTGTLSFNETAGTLTCHNLNSESTGALILNETTGELTYIKLVPQSPAVVHEQYPSFSCSDYSLPCKMNYQQLKSDTVILNESTGELGLINQTKDQELFDFDPSFGRSEDDGVMLFDPVDEDEEENDLLDIDPADLMNESNSNPEIPVLNEWTGEINLLPNNFIGGPFLDEQTGQLSVFDLFDNDLIFDCLEEPPSSNIILNENTGEILSNSKIEDYPSIGNDYRPNEVFTDANGDCAVFCDDLMLDSDLQYSLNEATGQLSIEWPDVSEDSNVSFLLNELTGELSVKENGG